jgi:NAD(P)-dependent dehydrogenase (short-subunit alcohol dehydrogenase family)
MRDIAGKNAAVAAELQAVAEKEKLNLHTLDLDVTDDGSVEHAVQQVIDKVGRIDVVVNNAGISYHGPLESFTAKQVQEQYNANVFSVIRVNRAVLPQMRKQGSGLLIQVGSVLGRLSFPFFGLYSSTKFALEGLTEAYSHELAPFGIDAAVIEPGTYPTSIGANSVGADQARLAPYAENYKAAAQAMRSAATGAGGTPPDPQEVADAIAHLIELPTHQRPLRTIVAVESQREAILPLLQASEQAIPALLSSVNPNQS